MTNHELHRMMRTALDGFDDDHVHTGRAKTVSTAYLASVNRLARPIPSTQPMCVRLPLRARVHARALVDASIVACLYIGAPIYITRPPPTVIDHLVVAIPDPARAMMATIRQILKIKANTVDIAGCSPRFVITYLRTLLTESVEPIAIRIRVYGNEWLLARVSTLLLTLALEKDDITICADSGRWDVGRGCTIALHSLPYRMPEWLTSL